VPDLLPVWRVLETWQTPGGDWLYLHDYTELGQLVPSLGPKTSRECPVDTCKYFGGGLVHPGCRQWQHTLLNQSSLTSLLSVKFASDLAIRRIWWAASCPNARDLGDDAGTSYSVLPLSSVQSVQTSSLPRSAVDDVDDDPVFIITIASETSVLSVKGSLFGGELAQEFTSSGDATVVFDILIFFNIVVQQADIVLVVDIHVFLSTLVERADVVLNIGVIDGGIAEDSENG
jgi:hypothetical protein